MAACASRGEVHIHINWSRATEHKRDPAGEKWCFGCRRRLPHDWVLYVEPPDSYYEPWWALECSGCHKDLTAFPGTVY